MQNISKDNPQNILDKFNAWIKKEGFVEINDCLYQNKQAETFTENDLWIFFNEKFNK